MKLLKLNFIGSIVFLVCFTSSVVFAGNWNWKTEKIKVADGVIIERVTHKKTGDLISEKVKIVYNGNYYEAKQNSDGAWVISEEGLKAYEKAKKERDSGTQAGSGGSC